MTDARLQQLTDGDITPSHDFRNGQSKCIAFSILHASRNQLPALGAMAKRCSRPMPGWMFGWLPAPRLKTGVGFADIVQEDQHGQSLQVRRIKGSTRRIFQRSPNSLTLSQRKKTSCHIGHVVQQGMHACQLFRLVSR